MIKRLEMLKKLLINIWPTYDQIDLRPVSFFFWFVRLLALRPLLAYCASLGWWRRSLLRSRWNVDWEGKTEVLGENLPQRHFCPSQNPTWPDPGLNPGRRGGKPATDRLSYGAAYDLSVRTEVGRKSTTKCISLLPLCVILRCLKHLLSLCHTLTWQCYGGKEESCAFNEISCISVCFPS
jgi:hypothetical protein